MAKPRYPRVREQPAQQVLAMPSKPSTASRKLECPRLLIARRSGGESVRSLDRARAVLERRTISISGLEGVMAGLAA